MDKLDFHKLRLIQKQLAGQVILTDQLDRQPQIIGGADVGYIRDGAQSIARGVIVLVEFPSLKLIEHQIAHILSDMPYYSGLLAFREYPVLQEAWKSLSQKPDLLLVDGQGIAHPNRLGLASHFGLLVNVPTIGVAKNRFCGNTAELGDKQNSIQPLTDKNQQIGWVLRSKKKCNPLYISPGHKMSLASSLIWVQRCIAGYRLPEPTRMADALASRRKLYQSC